MCKGPLLKALRRTWGARRNYVVVEDGDRKGYQSNKGKAAKEEVGIRALTLPPRTPSLMPLDYRIWTEVDRVMDKTAPAKTETKDEFVARLQRAGTSLKKGVVEGAIGRFRANFQSIVNAKCYHPKWNWPLPNKKNSIASNKTYPSF